MCRSFAAKACTPAAVILQWMANLCIYSMLKV
jgi:hypothetical protein